MSIEESYNSWAAIYDSNENRTRDLDKEVTVKILSKYSFDSVLELGCGTGKNTQWLVQRSHFVTAFDFSEKMLAVAQQKLKNPKITFVQSDLNQNWEVPDNSFDLVTASLVLEHIFDLETIFNKSYQKLKKKGLFFVCELHPFKQYLGTKARFNTEKGTQELEVYLHHTSEFINTALKQGFNLKEMKEWFDKSDTKNIPRLISFVFEK